MSIFNLGSRTAHQNRSRSQAGIQGNIGGNNRRGTAVQHGMPSTIGDMGSMLRARREAMGATLAEAETATRIRQKFLAALEADEWALLPGEVVGRGFLRNYAAYLGLEPTEILERRRAVIDARLASALSSTSAGVELPGVRAVDYRPKDMELRDDPDPISRGEIRMTPLMSILLSLLVLAILAWGITRFGGGLGPLIASFSLPGSGVTLADPNPATGEVPLDQTGGSGSEQIPVIVPVVTLAPVTGVVNVENATPLPAGDLSTQDLPAAPIVTPNQQVDDASRSVNIDNPPPVNTPAIEQTGDDIILFPTPIGGGAAATATSSGSVFVDTPVPAAIPTAVPTQAPTEQPTVELPTVELPTAELPTPTPLIPTPTPLPTTAPAPPPPSPPSCPDWRTVIATPFNNEVVRGTVQVIGTATHEDFRYYRIEYAFGDNATSGFTYFTGGNAPVFQGVLGLLDTTSLPNEAYTIRLVVIDGAGNFSPPCQVTLNFGN